MAHKNIKQFRNVSKCWMDVFLCSEGFFCSLDVLHIGLRIIKWLF
jgi:hypothetical protein